MEIIAGIVLMLTLVVLAFWGVSCEVKHMKAAVAKERKQTELYEKLLQKLEAYDA